MHRQSWIAILAALAGAQALVAAFGIGASALGWGAESTTNLSQWTRLAQIAVFGVTGCVLFLGGDRDSRAALLGVVFLLIGSAFAEPALRDLRTPLAGASRFAMDLLAFSRAHAFLPLVLWLFVEQFPRGLASRRIRAVLGVGIRASFAAGAFLAFTTFSIDFGLFGPSVAGPMALFDPKSDTSLYWAVLFGLMLPALAMMPFKARLAPESERRRVSLLLAGCLAGGIPPVLIGMLAPLVPGLAAFIETDAGERWIRAGMQPFIASIPLTASYAVRVQRVFEVRFFVRFVLQYALARSTLVAVTSIPFFVLAWYLFESRHLPLVEVMSGPRAVVPLAAGALGIVGLRLHQSIQAGLDRYFFREQYDLTRILLDLSPKLRDAPSIDEFSRRLTGEIDRALHLDAIDLLLHDREAQELRSPLGRTRKLPMSAPLVQRVEDSGTAVDVDLDREASSPRELPEADREWLADAGFGHLFPIIATTGELLGLIGLGGKRSGLSVTAEDLRLLAAVASSGGVALQSRLLPAALAAPDRESEDVAKECPACGRVESPKLEVCPACAEALVPSLLPHEVAGKFRLEKRIGTGAMGVVFRAADLSLDRLVAVKTLPRVSPEDALRLRREARTMASVTHPNLALIYGAEAWHGMPLLVIELLGGGTLSERLEREALSLREAVDLGLALAAALSCIHAEGVLHRDIKPSNVAYSEAGAPKLLDFGLARMLSSVRRSIDAGAGDRTASRPSGDQISGDPTSDLVGTPLYMSPEALWGEAADVSIDLWSTCVVLFEAIAGVHPFERDDWHDTFVAITRSRVPDIRRSRPECPEPMSAFFRDALNVDRSRRPANAAELSARLSRLI